MDLIAIRNAEASDFDAIVRLNEAEVQHTSAMDLARLPAFVYVDRIVVSADYSRHRLGSLLYTDLFEFARGNGLLKVTCEYNIVPANEPSRRFHDKFGFKELGTQWLANGSKQVSLQVAATS